ncbi:MAG TPA: tetratricopeptide repeat protein [Clostridiaceae bacterium]|nr:tetratricopeptide repeat protein [Clostridiaceae bacterium]
MNDKKNDKLIKYLLPIAVIIILFFFNTLLGILGIIVYILYILFMARSGIYKLIGSVRYSKGDMDNALKWLKKSYESNKANPHTAIPYAYLLLKSGKLDESEKVFSEILGKKLNADDRNLAKSNYALLLWKKGNLDEAVNMLEEVFKEYKTTTVYGSLGYLLILKRDLDRALEFNLEAYDYNSSNTIIQDNLGYTYYLRGEYDKAAEIYEKLLASNPTFPEAYYNYGLVLVKMGEPAKALEFMEKSLNYRLTFLSTITREEIEGKIEEVKALLGTPQQEEQ